LERRFAVKAEKQVHKIPLQYQRTGGLARSPFKAEPLDTLI
jgi:hypothetical protein